MPLKIRKCRQVALFFPNCYKAVVDDNIYSDVPVVASFVKQAKLFLPKAALVADAYTMKKENILSAPLKILI